MVRSFVGGLELIVSLLKSEDKEVCFLLWTEVVNLPVDAFQFYLFRP